MRSLPHSLKSRSFRRVTGGLCTLCMAVGTLGIPLPVPQVKSGNEPFPCMNCGCGCVNAEMCWRDCCCFSTEEKLAWARENGVAPPTFLVALAEEEQHEHEAEHDAHCCEAEFPSAEELAKLKPCCRARVLAACKKTTCASACCHESGAGCSQAKRRSSDRLVSGVLVFQVLKCQGLSLSVSLLPPCVPYSAELVLDSLSAEPDRIALVDQFYACTGDSPDVPPPRFCA